MFDFDSWSFEWASLMKFVNAFFNADSLTSTSAFRTLCLNEDSFFLSFSTSCSIFIVKIHFFKRKSILFLNDLIWVCSINWQIILVVEFVVDNLTHECFLTIALFQILITFLHSIVSIIRSSFFACSRQFSVNLSCICFEMIVVRLFRFSIQTSWESKSSEDLQFILRLFRDSD